MIGKCISHTILHLNDAKSLNLIHKRITEELKSSKPNERLKIYILIILKVMRDVKYDQASLIKVLERVKSVEMASLLNQF